jgi:hypothetical protein
LKIILNKKIDINKFSELISKFNVTDDQIKTDTLLNIYYFKKKKYLDKNYNQLRNVYLNSLNLNLRNQIKKMSEEDQFYRRKGNYQQDKQNLIDSINSKKIIEIFDTFGYPNESLIGDSSIDNSIVNITTMLLHTKDKERIDYFIPKIMEYIKKGKAPPNVYAFMYDQYNLYNGKKQYYGSYENKTDISIKELNKRRKTIGLTNYGYEKWRINNLYPEYENNFN